MTGNALLDFASADNILRIARTPYTPEPTPLDTQPRMPTGAGPLFPSVPAQPAPEANPYIPNYAPASASKPLTIADLGTFSDIIKYVETRGQKHPYQAKNPTTSASGAYQYVNKTWGNYGGYAEARLAPKGVQDAKFREDSLIKLRKFNGDPFQMIADHMLPSQARKPWMWTRPSQLQVRDKYGKLVWVKIPPVADYVRKAVENTPWASQLDSYLKAQGSQ